MVTLITLKTHASSGNTTEGRDAQAHLCCSVGWFSLKSKRKAPRKKQLLVLSSVYFPPAVMTDPFVQVRQYMYGGVLGCVLVLIYQW